MYKIRIASLYALPVQLQMLKFKVVNRISLKYQCLLGGPIYSAWLST